jgi:nucleotide-binding universal stress UspA family protein
MPENKSFEAPRIVAGVDGSPPSQAALRWAVRQARLTGATVDAVTAWRIPAAMTGYGWAPVPLTDCSDMEPLAQRVVDQAVADAISPGDPPVSGRIVQGFPGQVLVDASDGAALLVVGSRGHGGLSGALLGSVSQHCVHHAHCPVVVIRGDAATAQAA